MEKWEVEEVGLIIMQWNAINVENMTIMPMNIGWPSVIVVVRPTTKKNIMELKRSKKQISAPSKLMMR